MRALLKLIPLRVWLYLGIALAIAGLLAHDHIGWQKAKAKNIEISKLKITIEAERKAKVAEVAHVQENADTAKFVADNPLHGSLCVKPRVQASSAKPVNAGPSTATADVLTLSEGDIQPGGQPDPDIRHLFDLLGRRADEVSAELREWQTR